MATRVKSGRHAFLWKKNISNAHQKITTLCFVTQSSCMG